jgi:hypothetical protein
MKSTYFANESTESTEPTESSESTESTEFTFSKSFLCVSYISTFTTNLIHVHHTYPLPRTPEECSRVQGIRKVDQECNTMYQHIFIFIVRLGQA